MCQIFSKHAKKEIFQVFNGYLPIVEYLISKGANLEAKDNWKDSPLHYASKNGSLPIVEYLLSKGANIEEKDKNE